MKVSDWNVNHMLIISKIPYSEHMPEEEMDNDEVFQVLKSTSTFPADDPHLLELIDASLVHSFAKKADTGKTSSCKAYGFCRTPLGEEDHGKLKFLLKPIDHRTWVTDATSVARQFAKSPEAKPGLFVLMNIAITTDKGEGGTYFVFMSYNYEDMSRFDKEAGLVEVVSDVSSNCKPTSFLIYPYHNGFEADMDKAKISRKNATCGSLIDSLNVFPPQDTDALIAKVTQEAIAERHPEPEKQETYFSNIPKERELFGEAQFVESADLIPTDEVAFACNKSFNETVDNHGKKPKIRLTIDEGIHFDAETHRFNDQFFFLKCGEEKLLVVKGEKFLTKGVITPIEFLDIKTIDSESLEKIIKGE